MSNKSLQVAGAILAFLWLAGAAQAQIASLEGDVKGPDGGPVAGATIGIDRTDLPGHYQAKTDKKGHYLSMGLPVGTFQVTCNVDGADVGTVVVKTQPGSAARADFDLRATAGKPDQPGQPPALGSVYVNSQDAAERLQLDSSRNSFSLREGGQDFSGTYAVNGNVLRLHIVQLSKDVDIAIDGKRLVVNGDEVWVQPSGSSGWGNPQQAMTDAFKQGLAAEQAGNYQAAIGAFRRVLAIDPNQHAVWAHLGNAYANTGSPALAEAALAKTVELQPQNGAYRNNYAIALAKSNKMEDAWMQLEEAARLDPANSGQYFYNLGAILMNLGHGPEAGRAFSRSIAANPDFAESHYQYGVWLVGQAKIGPDGKIHGVSRARSEFETYLRLAPDGRNAQSARQLLDTIALN